MVVKRAAIERTFTRCISKCSTKLAEELAILRDLSQHQSFADERESKNNSGERSLLKNLGSWLGGLTIARLQPVLMIDLDVKGLILGIQAGRMIAVIPFVTKILEPAKDNYVFKPPNPWTALLALLAEIYLDALKLASLKRRDCLSTSIWRQGRQAFEFVTESTTCASTIPISSPTSSRRFGWAWSGYVANCHESQRPSLQGQLVATWAAGVSSFLNKTCSSGSNNNGNASSFMAAEQPSLSDAALPNIQAHARVHPQPNVPESVSAICGDF